MGFSKEPKGDYFETILTCDHVMNYEQKCLKCGNVYHTENMTKFKKCLCGYTKFDGPKPVKCTFRSRTAISKISAIGKQVKSSDDKQIREHYKTDPDRLAGKSWYCPEHEGVHK